MAVWGRFGKLLRREEADITVKEIFYRAVEQAVLIFLNRKLGCFWQ